MKIKNKKRGGLEKLQQQYGYLFTAHWIFGLILFFIVPLITSIIYAFSEISFSGGEISQVFAGLKNFKHIISSDAQYLDNLRDSLGSIFYSLPIIVSLSLILAIILNQKFFGRTAARAIFFLPVILVSSYVMVHMAGPHINAPLLTVANADTNNTGGLIDFDGILSGLNLPTQINTMLSDLLGNVFGLIWSCGVQTILFLSGLQSIQASLYEVSKIEGANKWEEFWFITVPMLRHVMTLVIVYTMIELFTAVDSPVMNQAYTLMQEKQVYDRSSAMLWLYFLIVCAVMGLILFIYNRYCLRKWE